jgi:hypothetical protein
VAGSASACRLRAGFLTKVTYWVPLHGVAGKEECTRPASTVPAVVTRYGQELFVIMIGIDPHKGSHTAVAVDVNEHVLAELKIRADRRQTERLLAWAAPFASAHLGDRRSRRAGLSAGSTAGGRR